MSDASKPAAGASDKPAATAKRRTAIPALTVNRLFVLLLGINGFIWLLTLVVMVWMNLYVDPQTGDMPKGKERLYSSCEKVWLMSSGAFIGLLGGKAGAPEKLVV